MTANDLPRIDPLRCTGCGSCVTLCPTQALAQEAGKATLHAPDRCTRCVACEEICPYGAISIPYVITFAPAARPAAGNLGKPLGRSHL